MNAYRYALKALRGALRNTFHPAILGVMLLPGVAAVLVWAGLSWWFWDSWSGAIESTLINLTSEGWLARLNTERFAGFAAGLLLLLLIAPAVLATAMLLSAIFAMPVLVSHVARREFPTLERRAGGTFVGSIVNAVSAVAAFALLWLVTLPLWLFLGPLAVVLPWALSAYLNQRLFRYDALSEHADPQEMRRVFTERFSDLFVLGLMTGLLYFVPFINLIAPVFSALAFTYLCLDELSRLRGAEQAPTTAT
ncbi:MAG: EI24 domain-containing protein [Betaproteobacteria bacterium]|nr:MAG: EI24 domain-containing protein [Betaproteobacteria bacterium]